MVFISSCSDSLLIVFLLGMLLAWTGAPVDEGWVLCAGWLLSFLPVH